MVIFDVAPQGFSGCSALEFVSWPKVLARQKLVCGDQMILSHRQTLYRICLLAVDTELPLACVIPRDNMAMVRHRASACFGGISSDRQHPHIYEPPQPTEFQRQRLQLLCDILDLVAVSGAESLSTHELAFRRIYPGMTVGRGAEWKSSSHRRRTQR
ncbi:MAG: DNA -binding domain-containing protein, partial [Blastomonas fulva]